MFVVFAPSTVEKGPSLSICVPALSILPLPLRRDLAESVDILLSARLLRVDHPQCRREDGEAVGAALRPICIDKHPCWEWRVEVAHTRRAAPGPSRGNRCDRLDLDLIEEHRPGERILTDLHRGPVHGQRRADALRANLRLDRCTLVTPLQLLNCLPLLQGVFLRLVDGGLVRVEDGLPLRQLACQAGGRQ